VDIFPVNADTAVRIELFDDEVDSVRSFDTMTQRSVENLEAVTILPARELIYPPGLRDSIVEKILNDLKIQIKKMEGKNNKSGIQKLEAKINSDIERFSQEYYFAGMDRYIPYIIEKPSAVIDYIDSEYLSLWTNRRDLSKE